jgi:hypothetical protein
LVSITWPPWLLNKLVLSQYEVERDQQILKAEVNHFSLESLQFGLSVEVFRVDTANLKTKMDELQLLTSRSGKQALNKEIESLRAQWLEKNRELEQMRKAQDEALLATAKRNLEVSHNLKVLIWYTKATRAVFVIALLTVSGGLVMSVVGFHLWYSRLQIYQDAMLKKQAAAEEDSKGTLDN